MNAPARHDSLLLGGHVLQRKCDCGQHTVAGGECESCQKDSIKLQRAATNAEATNAIPSSVNEVLRSPGRELDKGTQAYFGPRFRHDFSTVRVHTDAQAAESANAVNALAYTVGRHVVFGARQFAPQSSAGRRLLAHELTHVMQQQNGRAASVAADKISDASSPLEREAETTAQNIDSGSNPPLVSSGPSTVLHRVVKVENAKALIPNPGGKGLKQSNAVTVAEYFAQLCSGETPKIDEASGAVSMTDAFCSPPVRGIGHEVIPAGPSPAEEAKTATGCTCLCDLINSRNEWIVKVDDVSRPHTTFKDGAAAVGKKPGGSGGSVTTISPNSPKVFGSVSVSGKRIDYDPWLILGHELCGHGWLADRGQAEGAEVIAKLGRQPFTIDRENALRAEHQIEARGRSFRDPFCGESYERAKTGKAGSEFFDPDLMNFCTQARARCKKPNKGLFKIEEKIPDEVVCK